MGSSSVTVTGRPAEAPCASTGLGPAAKRRGAQENSGGNARIYAEHSTTSLMRYLYRQRPKLRWIIAMPRHAGYPVSGYQ